MRGKLIIYKQLNNFLKYVYWTYCMLKIHATYTDAAQDPNRLVVRATSNVVHPNWNPNNLAGESIYFFFLVLEI